MLKGRLLYGTTSFCSLLCLAYIYVMAFILYQLYSQVKKNDSRSLSPAKDNMKRFLVSAYLHVRTLFIGFVIALSLCCYVVEHISYMFLTAMKIEMKEEYEDYSLANLFVFLSLCLSFVLISPFSGMFKALAMACLYAFYPTHFIGRSGRDGKDYHSREPVFRKPTFEKTVYDEEGNPATVPMTFSDIFCCLSWCTTRNSEETNDEKKPEGENPGEVTGATSENQENESQNPKIQPIRKPSVPPPKEPSKKPAPNPKPVKLQKPDAKQCLGRSSAATAQYAAQHNVESKITIDALVNTSHQLITLKLLT